MIRFRVFVLVASLSIALPSAAIEVGDHPSTKPLVKPDGFTVSCLFPGGVAKCSGDGKWLNGGKLEINNREDKSKEKKLWLQITFDRTNYDFTPTFESPLPPPNPPVLILPPNFGQIQTGASFMSIASVGIMTAEWLILPQPGTETIDPGEIWGSLARYIGNLSEHAKFDISKMTSIEVVTNCTPVPEPETYAMLSVGLGFLGLMARRRKLK